MSRGIDFKGVNMVINYDFPQVNLVIIWFSPAGSSRPKKRIYIYTACKPDKRIDTSCIWENNARYLLLMTRLYFFCTFLTLWTHFIEWLCMDFDVYTFCLLRRSVESIEEHEYSIVPLIHILFIYVSLYTEPYLWIWCTQIYISIQQSAVSYIHRIGRTGRNGRKGLAVTFFTERDMVSMSRVFYWNERYGYINRSCGDIYM